MSRTGQACPSRSPGGALSGFQPWDALRALSEARRFARKGMPPLELQELLVRHGLPEEAAARRACCVGMRGAGSVQVLPLFIRERSCLDQVLWPVRRHRRARRGAEGPQRRGRVSGVRNEPMRA